MSLSIRALLGTASHFCEGVVLRLRTAPAASPQDPTVGLCLVPYGGPRGVGVSYEGGTPVTPNQQAHRTAKAPQSAPPHPTLPRTQREREIFIDNLLVRVHSIIEMSRPALRHRSLNSLFQVALYLPSYNPSFYCTPASAGSLQTRVRSTTAFWNPKSRRLQSDCQSRCFESDWKCHNLPTYLHKHRSAGVSQPAPPHQTLPASHPSAANSRRLAPFKRVYAPPLHF